MEDRKHIGVRTVGNGYLLDIGTREYMYFGERELLRGILYHLGLGEQGFASGSDMERVLSACVSWTDRGELVKRALEQESRIERLEAQLRAAQERIRVLSLPKVDGRRVRIKDGGLVHGS